MIPEELIVYPLFAVALVFVCTKLFVLMIETADELDIYVFRTDSKSQDRLRKKLKDEDICPEICSCVGGS